MKKKLYDEKINKINNNNHRKIEIPYENPFPNDFFGTSKKKGEKGTR